RTTIPALERIIGHPDFRAGRLSTGLLERILPALHAHDGQHASIALIAAVLAEYERTRQPASAPTAPQNAGPSAWARSTRPGQIST
ncbi:MAG TPA: hypothetical protein VGM22_08190, partial [Methylomirabilota bacterium]